MVSIYDVDANELIEKTAGSLKEIEQIKPPEWASFVKTGRSKERPPMNADWWYIRTAAVLRSVYKLGPVGVSKLRTKYGSKKNRGVQPEKFFRGSGNILRKILQQLESAELVKKDEVKGYKGRVIAPKGVSVLSKAALSASKAKPKKEVKEEPKVEKKEEKKIEEKPKIEKKEVKEKPAGKPKVEETKKTEAKKEEKKNG